MLGESLGTSGKFAESDAVIKESIALADQLLARRPGHRPALRNKASMQGQLAANASRQLQAAEAIRYARESLRTQEEVLALDPGSSNSQNNRRVAMSGISSQLANLGQVDEALSQLRNALVIPPNERLTGFSAFNLSAFHTYAASVESQLGNQAGAKAELANADRYAVVAKAAGVGEAFRVLGSLLVAGTRSDVVRMNNDKLAAQRTRKDLDEAIAAFVASVASTRVGGGQTSGRGLEEVTNAYRQSAGLSIVMGEFAAAETTARKAVDAERANNDVPANVYATSQARAVLAVALARQGKFAEANQALAPALAFYRSPTATKSDVVTLKISHAEALLAAAVANPKEKAKYLGDALRRLDALPATMKPLKDVVQLRAEIAAEMKR